MSCDDGEPVPKGGNQGPLKSQRIYVGGIDPDRLSVQEVLDRLKLHLEGAHCALDEIHMGSCYFQANASCSESKTKPLEVAQKLLNNVNWKGCKIKVESARPHFLERLAQEREQPKSSHCISEPISTNNDNARNGNSLEQTRRRYYKIRRGYGETVWNVDTKPYEVADFADFNLLRMKLKRRHNDDAREAAAPSPKQGKRSKLLTAKSSDRKAGNRAIHIRFDVPPCKNGKDGVIPNDDDDDDDVDVNKSSSGATSKGDAKEASFDASDSSRRDVVVVVETNKTTADRENDSDEDSSSSESSNNKEKETYPWSSSSEEDSDNENHAIRGKKDTKNQTDPTAMDGQAPAADQASVKESDKKNNDHQRQQEQVKKYQWSSSDENEDEDSNDENKNDLDYKNREPKSLQERWNPMDEFAMGEQAGDDDDDDDDNRDETMATGKKAAKGGALEENAVDYEKEKESNFLILSQLFPDFVRKDEEKQKAELAANSLQKKETVKTGWNASGQMLRFDPTLQSSRQFVVEDNPSPKVGDEPVQKSGSDNEDDSQHESNNHNDDADADDDDDDENENKGRLSNTAKTSGGHVYHQSELEAVFRQAREEEYNNNNSSNNNNASHVLDLGTTTLDNQATTNEAAGGFTFAFNVGEVSSGAKIISNNAGLSSRAADDVSKNVAAPGPAPSTAQQQTVSDRSKEMAGSGSSNDDGDRNVSGSSFRKRQFGVEFPQQDLDHYMQAFLEFDDGKRILQDPKGYHKDPEIQRKWDQERKTLTQDWKTKRKTAVAARKHSHHHYQPQRRGGHR